VHSLSLVLCLKDWVDEGLRLVTYLDDSTRGGCPRSASKQESMLLRSKILLLCHDCDTTSSSFAGCYYCGR
jgi:hypothetical protein